MLESEAVPEDVLSAVALSCSGAVEGLSAMSVSVFDEFTGQLEALAAWERGEVKVDSVLEDLQIWMGALAKVTEIALDTRENPSASIGRAGLFIDDTTEKNAVALIAVNLMVRYVSGETLTSDELSRLGAAVDDISPAIIAVSFPLSTTALYCT